MNTKAANLRPFGTATPSLGARVYVDVAATVIGAVTLGDDVSIWPAAVLRGDVERIRVGARSNLQDGAIVHVTHANEYTPGGFACTVGADVTVGHGAVIHGCTVEDACLIGMHATILDGAVIGAHSLVGAGALVAPGTRVGSGELWLGSPARRVRALSAREMEQIEYAAAHYVRLKDRYLAQG